MLIILFTVFFSFGCRWEQWLNLVVHKRCWRLPWVPWPLSLRSLPWCLLLQKAASQDMSSTRKMSGNIPRSLWELWKLDFMQKGSPRLKFASGDAEFNSSYRYLSICCGPLLLPLMGLVLCSNNYLDVIKFWTSTWFNSKDNAFLFMPVAVMRLSLVNTCFQACHK